MIQKKERGAEKRKQPRAGVQAAGRPSEARDTALLPVPLADGGPGSSLSATVRGQDPPRERESQAQPWGPGREGQGGPQRVRGPGPAAPLVPATSASPPTAALGSKNMKGRGTRVPSAQRHPRSVFLSSATRDLGTPTPRRHPSLHTGDPPPGKTLNTVHPTSRAGTPPPRQVPQYSGRTHPGRHPAPTQAPRCPEARLHRQRLRSTRAPLVARAAGVLLNERVVLPGQLLPLVLREVLV